MTNNEMIRRKLPYSLSKGFTLVELVVAFAVLVIIMVGLLTSLLQVFMQIQDSNERIKAVNSAEMVLNQLRSANIDPGQFPANVAAAFPPGEIEDAQNNLSQGVVTVSYEDVNTNPLQVRIRIDYLGRQGRNQSETLETYLSNF